MRGERARNPKGALWNDLSMRCPNSGAGVALRISNRRGCETGVRYFRCPLIHRCFGAAVVQLLPFGARHSGGPLFYRQRRIGFRGREFTCLKFRTMAVDAERRLRGASRQGLWTRGTNGRKYHKLRNDPRITPFGRLMRRASLDELPQLFNVLKGDMSLVGPRPIVADEVAKYQENFSHYASARPGLTGLWQVSGRNSTTYAERVAYDVEYVRNWSLVRDIKICSHTPAHVIDREGRLLRLRQ